MATLKKQDNSRIYDISSRDTFNRIFAPLDPHEIQTGFMDHF